MRSCVYFLCWRSFLAALSLYFASVLLCDLCISGHGSAMARGMPEDRRSPSGWRSAESHRLQQGHQRMWETGGLEEGLEGLGPTSWKRLVHGIHTGLVNRSDKFASVFCFSGPVWSFLCFIGYEPASPTLNAFCLNLFSIEQVFTADHCRQARDDTDDTC